ncbi:hypothetical protein ACRRTK_024021 [Alexandromys fortis]
MAPPTMRIKKKKKKNTKVKMRVPEARVLGPPRAELGSGSPTGAGRLDEPQTQDSRLPPREGSPDHRNRRHPPSYPPSLLRPPSLPRTLPLAGPSRGQPALDQIQGCVSQRVNRGKADCPGEVPGRPQRIEATVGLSLRPPQPARCLRDQGSPWEGDALTPDSWTTSFKPIIFEMETGSKAQKLYVDKFRPIGAISTKKPSLRSFSVETKARIEKAEGNTVEETC